jgi:hypothetical protein
MSQASPESHPVTRLGIVSAVSLVLATSFGFNFGVGNQSHYLLPSLKILDPELYLRDWTFTHSTHYHGAYAYLGAALIGLEPHGWAVALAHTAVVAAGTAALYALLRALVPQLALPGFLLLVTLLLASRTRGPCHSHAFDNILQPSTLSSAAMFGAIAALVAGRYRVSGVLLGISGLFHVNFLVLAAASFGIAQLALGRRGLVRRGLEQLGPAAAVLLLLSPMLLGAVGGGDEAKVARAIYLYVRAPHHFVLAGKELEFGPVVGWTLVAAGLNGRLLREPDGQAYRRAAACALGLGATIALGAAAAQVSDGARAAFPWRLTPHLEIVLQTMAIAAVLRLAAGAGAARALTARESVAVAVGFALLVASLASFSRWLLLGVTTSIGVALTVHVLWQRSSNTHAAFVAQRARFGIRPLVVFGALVVVAIGGFQLKGVARRSSLLKGLPKNQATLFEWMRENSAKSSVFLIPPDLAETRFHSQRGVVVDWKGMPAIPSEGLAWYRRIEDVTNRRGLKSVAELDGYDELDPKRLEELRVRYGFDYAVVRRRRESAFKAYAKPYRNREFVVLAASPSAATPRRPPR